MSDSDQSYIVKKRDIADIIQIGDSDAIAELLESPASVIAETITGWLASGSKAGMLATGRIVQGALKGRLFKQFAREFNDFRAKGKSDPDFADKKLGFQTWVELLTVIDEDTPDEERLEALKAMFFAVNKINTADGQRILGYQLFQIAKRLRSGELMLLKAVNEARKAGKFATGSQGPAHMEWIRIVLPFLSHSLEALVDHDEKALVENSLIASLLPTNTPQVYERDGRLTDLGIRFCENIEKYRLENGDAS